MTNQLTSTSELHRFPLSPETEALDFVELAEHARSRLALHAGVTSLEHSPVLSYRDNDVYVKRADELPGGNFKYLSAMNSVAELVESGHEDFSFATAGSYGMGVGHAIKTYGGHATAFMPKGSNPNKQSAMLEMGVDVREHGDNFDESLQAARHFAAAKKIMLLHPFADVNNFAGTGIIGLELLEQQPDMTHLVTQFGGGSLTCGTGGVVLQKRLDVQMVVSQAAACDPFVKSLETGQAEEVPDTFRWGRSFFKSLGGVGVGKTDPMTLGVGSRIADKTYRVHIDDVYGTMFDFQEAHGVLPEVAAAHGLEAARQLARAPGLEDATIVAVLTGANPDEYKPGYLEAMSRRRAGKPGMG